MVDINSIIEGTVKFRDGKKVRNMKSNLFKLCAPLTRSNFFGGNLVDEVKQWVIEFLLFGGRYFLDDRN